MATSLLELRDRTQRWLVDLGLQGIEITNEGGFTFRVGSTRCFIALEERGEGDNAFTTVIVTAPFLQRARPTPELFEWIARETDSWVFGHLGLLQDRDSKDCIVLFTHTLLGDYLDQEEFNRAVISIAGTADSIDNDLAVRFSCATFHDED